MGDHGDSVTANERTASAVFIALSMLLGLAVPEISEMLFDYVFHFLFLVIVMSFCTLNANILMVGSSVSPTTWMAMCWQMVGIPMIATLVCFMLNADFLTTAVVIATTTAGSVFASPALANLVGLDQSMTIRKMLLSTMIMPVSLLLFGELNGIITHKLSIFNYIQHVVYFLLLPVVLAVLYWESSPKLGEAKAKVVHRFMHWAATLTMMGFCCGMMSSLHGGGEEGFAQIVYYAVLVVVLVTTIYVVTGLLFAHLGRRRAITLGMLAANRNVALSFALISDVLPKDALVYVAIAQFPIFLSPIVARALQAFFAARSAKKQSPDPSPEYDPPGREQPATTI